MKVSRIPLFFSIGISIITFLPFLAPVLYNAGLKDFAGWIYKIYSFFCHQLDSRSLYIGEAKFAWCIRDTFIWLGIWVSCMLVFYVRVKYRLKLYQAIILCLPMVLDAGTQLISELLGLFRNGELFYASDNVRRALTGGLFGFGIGFFLFPRLMKEIEASLSNR